MQLVKFLSLVATSCLASYAQAQPTVNPVELNSSRHPDTAVKTYPLEVLEVSPILQEKRMDVGQGTLFMVADEIQAQPETEIRLQGRAQLRQHGLILKGDEIVYDVVEDVLRAQGSVRLLTDGNIIMGPNLELQVGSRVGQIESPVFQIAKNGASGHADLLLFQGENRYSLKNATYSGCQCEVPAWYIKAERIDLDYNLGEGVGHNGVLYFKDFPILAAPVLSFPLGSEPKSGFLVPTIGTTTKGGLEITTPYYFNIAPNRDATLYPRIIQRRGLLLGGEFRYLEPSFNGSLYGEALPNDARADRDRYFFQTKQTNRLGYGANLLWDWSWVSDDAYFRDLSQTNLGQEATNYLERHVTLNWNNSHWSAGLRTVDYRILQDPNAYITAPYDRAPEFTVEGTYFDWYGLDVNIQGNATQYKHDYLREGSRVFVYPSVSYPIVIPGGQITPKMGMHLTRYQTDAYHGLESDSQNRSVPIFSLDSQLTFERESSFLGNPATQTLEPRLYYLHVPYRDQSNLPVYDSAIADFNFSQIFSENLYSGWDRIVNANQLTAGLTTRWIDDQSGRERARATVAQRTYFTDQQVTLPNEYQRTNGRSDYLLSVSGALLQGLSAEATLQYNPYDKQFDRSVITTRWSPARLSTVSLSYRYQRESPYVQPQEQVDMAFQWPLSKNVYGVGRVQYSLLESRLLESLAGVEYKSDCCWSLRVVAQRYAVAKEDATTALFLQLELQGLGRLGSSPLSALRRGIPGYEMINSPIEPRSAYERYE